MRGERPGWPLDSRVVFDDEPLPLGHQDEFSAALADDGSAAANRRQKAQPEEAVPGAALAEQVPSKAHRFQRLLRASGGVCPFCSRKRQSEIAGVRWDLAAIAVGRYGHRICDLAAILNKNAGSVSRWLTEADRRQTSDPEYRTHLDHLEHKMVEVAVQNITM